MILLALSGALPSIHRGFLALSQLLLLVVVWIRSRAVNVWHDEQAKAFYQLIWKLFFLEYLLFPVAALLA